MYQTAARSLFRVGFLVTLVLTLSACGGNGSAEDENQARSIPKPGKPLSAGEYVTEEFEPRLSFSVGEGWIAVIPETRDALGIAEKNGPLVIGFQNVEQVSDPSDPSETIPAPDDMVAWLQEHPALEVEEPSRTSVGGVSGQQFDAIAAEPTSVPGCPEPCVPLFVIAGGRDQFWLGESEKYRFIVLDDVEGETVMILYGGAAVEFEETIPKAQKVLNTVEWRG